MACAWTMLRLEHVDFGDNSTTSIHVHSIYDVLQLLQGQGVETTTTSQDLFCSIVMLFGSISKAVIFGHVAILLANFRANQTNYQRKIEHIFDIVDKLQLPQPNRERAYQYYDYLHTEYESLDSDVVKFARDLSHTLELEVVLYKYMEVVVNVPHWSSCSPDFQNQLVLNLTIRVYLSDDLIIRRGEVGTACFIVNRGICKQYHYIGGNDIPTLPLHRLSEERDLTRVTRPSERKHLVRDSAPALDSSRTVKSTGIKSISLARGHTMGNEH